MRSSFNDKDGDTFFSYLISQRALISVALAISVLLFIILKYAFPLPDFFVDSSNYITWALHNFTVAYRPIGYSVFLKLAHFVSSSPSFTVFIQYCFFVFSALFCFFSAEYLFHLPKKFKIPILILIVCNPVLIFQTNLISSDSLFCSLTITWFTACMWIIKKHNWGALVLQLLFLFFCFQVRYTAMFYPVVALFAFVFCIGSIAYRITGGALTLLVLFFSVERQMNVVEKETGTRVFSGFGGWQVANNALYCYKHIQVNSNDLPDWETQVIDHCVKIYIDSIKQTAGIGAAYLWDPKSPFKKYLNICARRDRSDYLAAWFTASRPLGEYGWYIIRHYPAAFTQYFLLPNTTNYFYPDLEILANYDYGNITLTPDTKQWFGLDVDHLDCRFPFLQERIMYIYPFLSLLLNAFNIAVIIYFICRRAFYKKRMSVAMNRLFIIWCIFYCSFMVFSIFAAAISIRFLDILFVIGIIVPFLFFEKESLLPGNIKHTFPVR